MRLRLVNPGGTPDRTPASRVEAENALAAALPAADARAIFASDVAGRLGVGAMLRPADRRSLIARAVGMGFREFDANLVIAIVQDRSRRGVHGAAGDDARLSLIAPANPHPHPSPHAGPGPMIRAALWLGLALAAVYIMILRA
ncbi:MAG: hypothetical protein HRU70_15225 [Phycisphaeraceae bacterium]|nr:MAG: hypothetical protein HRU70_15225 [Phycisphaeraceae bacterium]